MPTRRRNPIERRKSKVKFKLKRLTKTVKDVFSKRKKTAAEILISNTKVKRKQKARKSIQFQGICLDTGAQKSVVGKKQAAAYAALMKVRLETKASNFAFKFGDGCYKSLGTIPVRIPKPNNGYIEVRIDIVDADIPMIIGLDILDKETLLADNTENLLIHKKEGWKMPLSRKAGHLYLEWNYAEVLYTRSELQKMHLHFFHPSASKLFNLVMKAKPENCTNETKALLKEISESCEVCQRFSPRQSSFQVSLPNKVTFNYEVALDLMKITGIAILHVVDTQTNFSAATILRGESLEDVWYAFLDCWAAIYTGYPSKMKTDQGSVFTSPRWKQITDMTGIELQLSGVESHNSLGKGERYHAPLRRIFLKIKDHYPNLENELILKLAVKAMNDTMGPNGLVPSLLVFGVLPRFPAVSTNLPNQEDRMKALEIARSEMEAFVAEARVRTALNSNIPATATTVFHPGQEVLVYREKAKPNQWTGPYHVTRVEDKQVFIDRDGEEVQHSATQIKPFIKNAQEDLMLAMKQTFEPLSTSVEKKNCEVLINAVQTNDGEDQQEVLLTKTLHPADKEQFSQRFDEAKAKEIEGLEQKETWTVVDGTNLPSEANVLTGRFVLAIKNVGQKDEKAKARFVVQGHRDKEKNFLVHNTTTARQSSTRILASIAAINGFKIWSHDVSQAYLQSADNLRRDVYIKAPKEFNLKPGHVLKLLKPLYGLTDAGDYWNYTMKLHLVQDLGMTTSTADPSLFVKYENGKLIGVIATYVDDSLICGTDKFMEMTNATLKKFDSREREMAPTKFAGVLVSISNEGVTLNQSEYIQRLTILPEDCTFHDLRSMRAKLAWITHTRPDISCAVNMAAQVTEATMSMDHTKALNKVIKHLRKTPRQSLVYPKLDLQSLKLKVYADSSFANNADYTSQLGYIVLLTDKTNTCHVLHYSSHKSRRVTRSVLGGEVYAFADAFDRAYIIKREFQNMLGKSIPLTMFTDSKSLFDVITKCSITTEKRLMIDIKSVREAYDRQEGSDVGFLRSEFNAADTFYGGGTQQGVGQYFGPATMRTRH